MHLYSFLCPFRSLPIPLCSAQIYFPIQHFSPALNSKPTCKSFCDFSYSQTPHDWITDMHRITTISLKVGLLKAFTYVWCSGAEFVVQRNHTDRNHAFQHPPICSLPLVFLLQCTTCGSSMLFNLPSVTYRVYFPSGYLSHLFSCVYNIFLLSANTYYSFLSSLFMTDATILRRGGRNEDVGMNGYSVHE